MTAVLTVRLAVAASPHALPLQPTGFARFLPTTSNQPKMTTKTKAKSAIRNAHINTIKISTIYAA